MDEQKLVTWEEVTDFIVAASNHFSNEHVSGVYGLPRGGLVLAVMLSHAMKVPLLMAPAEGCLIVDDICDSGESLLHYVRNTSGDGERKYSITTMYYKEGASVTPDFYFRHKFNAWVKFPWEL